MKKLIEATDYKSIIIKILFAISFVFVGTFKTFSSSNFLLFLFLTIVFGLFLFLVVELFISFLQKTTKDYCNISNTVFSQSLRLFLIISNVIIFTLCRLFLLINFYPALTMLLAIVLLWFIASVFAFVFFKKNYELKKDFTTWYFVFVFAFLCLVCLLWGVI